MHKDSGLEIIARTEQIQSDSQLVLPIDSSQIPHFGHWIRKPKFNPEYEEFFLDYDRHFENLLLYIFAAYSTQDGKEVLGLPRKTKVRAISDGTVDYISTSPNPIRYVKILHANRINSFYLNVIPLVKISQSVKIGEVIGTLDNSEYEKYQVSHMQFRLYKPNKVLEMLNPALIFPELQST